MKKVGISISPSDAIEEVKMVSDIILKRKGGEGCIAEIYTMFSKIDNSQKEDTSEYKITSILMERMNEHLDILNMVMNNTEYVRHIEETVKIITDSYQKGGHLFLCGNGGSAADAQHLAAELVGRFYLERRALSAEALTVNSSILTSLANDYNFNMIFARQLEAKAAEGDVLIGITTSGTSENILEAFRKAKEMCVQTILLTGDISDSMPVLEYTDCLLSVPSQNTPRIQEIHILTGHIICEMIEKEFAR